MLLYCRSGKFRVFKFCVLNSGLFTKVKIREFSFPFSEAIMIIFFAILLNSPIYSPREIRENKTSRISTDLRYLQRTVSQSITQ